MIILKIINTLTIGESFFNNCIIKKRQKEEIFDDLNFFLKNLKKIIITYLIILSIFYFQ